MVLSEQRRIIAQPGVLPNLAVAVGAIALPLCASVVNLLRFNDYPLLAPEATVVLAAVFLAAVVVGSIYLLGGRLVRIVIEVAVVALAVDLNTRGIPAVGGAVIATLLVALIARRSLAPPIAFASFVLLALTVIGVGVPSHAQPQAMASAGSARPVLLHLILDEQIGIEGMPADNPASPARQAQLRQIYLGQGFRVYGGAFSRHMRTTNAVPDLMNFGVRQPTREDNRTGGLPVRENAYFDQLRTLGYRLAVYQNGWVSLCAGDPAIRCVNTRETGLEGLHEASLSTRDKAELVAMTALALSDGAQRARELYDREGVGLAARVGLTLKPIGLAQPELTSSFQGLRAAAMLTADLEKARPGQAYIAHLLLPHYPYAARADCTLKPRSEWRHRRHFGTLRQRQDAYFEQVLCAAKVVSDATAAIERSPAGRNYIVIVHGDHGSRITRRDPNSASAPAAPDLIASYSTLFAIKAANVPPGYVAEPAAIDRLLATFARSAFSAAPAPEPGDDLIWLEDRMWRPARKATMPANWAGSP